MLIEAAILFWHIGSNIATAKFYSHLHIFSSGFCVYFARSLSLSHSYYSSTGIGTGNYIRPSRISVDFIFFNGRRPVPDDGSKFFEQVADSSNGSLRLNRRLDKVSAVYTHIHTSTCAERAVRLHIAVWTRSTRQWLSLCTSH